MPSPDLIPANEMGNEIFLLKRELEHSIKVYNHLVNKKTKKN